MERFVCYYFFLQKKRCLNLIKKIKKLNCLKIYEWTVLEKK